MTKEILPNLIIIGAPKCATTSLHSYLSKHPEIFMSRQKELHFFLMGVSWGTWERGINWYEEQFIEGANKPIRGEASPGYSIDKFTESTAEQIAYFLPSARLIYMIRDPIERIRSNYTEELYGGRIPPSIPLDTILSANSEEIGILGHYCNEFVRTSLYQRQLLRYLKYYPLNQILIMPMESLFKYPTDSLKRIWRFLGINEDFIPPNINEKLNQKSTKRLRTMNPTSLLLKLPNYSIWSKRVPNSIKDLYRRLISKKFDHTKLISISPNNLERLQATFKADVEELESTTGLNFDDWSIQ